MGLSVRRTPPCPAPHRLRGVVTVEYALLLMLGVVPLLMLTLTGVLIFAAQQSLSLAAAEGARASLRYGEPAQRRTAACEAAREAMGWLLSFSGQQANCASPSANASGAPIAVTPPFACTGTPERQCMRVTVRFDYDRHPLFPGTGTLFGWTVGRPLSSAATAQLDLGG